MSFALVKRFQSLWSTDTQTNQKPGFGTFIGVYVPSILMMFGVIIYLRLGWILGMAGLYPTLIIVTLASLITLITTLSISAAATNIKVGKGGAYYMISRALGIELGSAIGIPLFLKQAISISFCTVGFAESFHGLYPNFDIPTIGIVTLLTLTALAYVSTNFMLKIQIAIFVIMIASLYSLFAGGTDVVSAPAVIPPEASTLPFWTVFAIFFPAMTGLESSVSLSGDLKNPSRSLPIGTIAAVITAYVVYMAIPIFLWNYLTPDQLINDPLAIPHVAKYESLIILGIWGATLSSAIGGLLGAPRTMQALAEDGIFPRFLAKEYGKTNEPRIATAVTVTLSLIGVYYGSINVIAPLLTMICLITYAMLNLATGLEDLMANPSWRPAFPLPWAISLSGTLLCVVAMLMINSGAAILALCSVLIIYFVLKQKKMSSAWEDIRYGILMFFSRSTLYRLASELPSSRSWRPNFLVFTGRPSEVSDHVLSFATAITQTKGFMTIASLLTKDETKTETLEELHANVKALLKEHRIEALVCLNQAKTVISGMKQMIRHYGMGPLTPNTIVCGGTSKEDNRIQYLEMLQLAHEQGRNVVIINEEQNQHASFEILSRKIKGEIHVWWDDASPRNTELMLVLAYMLKKNPRWRKTKICLMGVVANETMRVQRQEEFNELIDRNRLKINTKVLVAPEASNYLELIKHFSSQAVMLFIGMRAPHAEESLETYAQYFQTLPHKSQDFPPVALIMSAKQMNLQEVVQVYAIETEEEVKTTVEIEQMLPA
jgi:solute carrier family 12 (potassium/chloride transporter), member 4/6